MVEGPVAAHDPASLTAIVGQAASAWMRGDVHRYLALIEHSDDYTLMPPTGGDTVRGFAMSEERLEETARFFKSGDAELEVVGTYESGNLVVLAAVEHQRGLVGEYPEQDWSLRVTLVFRRTASGWHLVHRHADPLVHPIGFDRLAELCRG